jgi:site-specific DNA-methyltransferase (adenine-specific)
MKTFQLMQGNSLELLKTIEDNSVDAIVTDPPYGLSQHSQGDIVNALTAWLAGEEYTHGKAGFMGKAWDSFVPSPMLFKECYRVLKHGGHILCFAGSRTQDLMSLSIRLAGFEMRDACLWLYGSGFPKGQNIGKSVDKKLGNKREKIQNPFHGRNPNGRNNGDNLYGIDTRTDLTTDFSKGNSEWEGWNTNLKPAYEPIIMARKPLDGTVVNNVLKHGVGGLNIDACRVKTDDVVGWGGKSVGNNQTYQRGWNDSEPRRHTQGRYPANIILDGSESVEALFPFTKSPSGYSQRKASSNNCMSGGNTERFSLNGHGDAGSATRYFYHAKASKADRDEGVNGMNPHPTVKPTQLMRYLVKLVTPQGGTVLDPFMGSGSTGKACMLEGMRFIGMELSEEYVKIAEARIEHAYNQMGVFYQSA